MNTPTPPGRRVAKPRTGRKTAPHARPAQAPIDAPAEAPAPEQPPAEMVPAPEVAPEAPVEAPAPAEVPPQPASEPQPQPAPEAPAPAPQPQPTEAPEQPFQRRSREDRRRDERRQRREERRQQNQPPQMPAEKPQPMGPQTRGLTLLGAKTTVYSDHYTPAILEAFENRHPGNDFFVKFNCPEFTSLCPITGQPDFATIYISYIPDRKIVESKSLKLYLFSFRNHGAFHEDCVNTILEDLVRLLAPRYIEVWGKFMPRGGLSIDPYANYGRPSTRWEEFARQRLLMHDLAPERVDNR